MFSSADGYCSAVVFSDGELGMKYEKQPEPVEEYDVEMMDIASHTNTNSSSPVHTNEPTLLDVAKAQKRRVSIAPIDLVVENNTIMEKPKKRRVTPILISTPLQITTPNNDNK